MKNSQLVRLFPKRSEMEQALKNRQAEARKLQRVVDNIATKLRQLRTVQRVYSGVAVSVWRDDDDRFELKAVGDDIDRWGTAYVNASDNKYWGVNLRESEDFGGDFQGANWPSREAAVQAVIDWVVKGKKPTKTFK